MLRIKSVELFNVAAVGGFEELVSECMRTKRPKRQRNKM